MKNTEIKKGTILYANTGVAVKVLEYSSKFGGRVLIERADGIESGKPMWKPLAKFSETNPYPQKKHGGSFVNNEIQLEDKVQIVKNIEDHEGYKKNQLVEVVGIDDDNYFHVEGVDGTQWYVGEEEIKLVKKGSGKHEAEILKQSAKTKKDIEIIRKQIAEGKFAKGTTVISDISEGDLRKKLGTVDAIVSGKEYINNGEKYIITFDGNDTVLKRFVKADSEIGGKSDRYVIEAIIPKYSKGSTVRANKSSLLRYVNFEDNWHINLIELNSNRNNNGLKYKNKNQYTVVRSSKEKGQEVFEFKTLSEAEERFDKLVEKSKTYSNVISEGKTNNYEKGGNMPKSFEYSIGGL